MAEKDEAKVKAGKAGAEARWRDERAVVRLDDLTIPQRRLVVALVDVVREQGKPR